MKCVQRLRMLVFMLIASRGALGEVQQAPAASDSEKVLARLNYFRGLAGLDAVAESKALSTGCQLHADYISRHPEIEGMEAHQENRNLDGFSEAGRKSASRSVISRECPSKDSAARIDNLMSTFYHRLPLLHPRLRSVGIGVANYRENGKLVVVDVEDLDWSINEKTRPVLYPADNQTDVPLEFALGGSEWPDPRPNKDARVGYPITLICARGRGGWEPGEASGKLEVEGKEVPCWVFTREKPAIKERPEPSVVCLLPKEPLKAKTRYTVTVRCKQYDVVGTPDWSKTWSFTTQAEEKR